MEEKFSSYKAFNWNSSEEWNKYLKNLDPQPEGDKLEYFKRKFYKQSIDKDFDRNYKYTSTAKTQCNSNQGTNQSQSQSRSTYNTRPNTSQNTSNSASQSLDMIYLSETILWILFLVTSLIRSSPFKFSIGALIIRLYRTGQRFTMSKAYLKYLFSNENFQILIYSVLFTFENLNYFILISPAITSVLYIGGFVRRNHNLVPAKVLDYANALRNNRDKIVRFRGQAELAVFVFLLFGMLFGVSSFISPIFYFQYMKFKYTVNDDTKRSFSELNAMLNSLKSQYGHYGLIVSAIDKIQNIGNYLGGM